MTRPECPKPADLLSPLPTVEELEKDFPITGSSLIDQPGTRYYMSHLTGRTNVVWETTEVVQLKQGHSLVFSPLWYHRVIPPSDNVTHAAMTLTAQYNDERSIGGNDRRAEDYRLLIPNEIEAETSVKLVCFTLLDLYYALVDPNFDAKRGLELFPCTEGAMYLADDQRVFNMFLDHRAKPLRVTEVMEDDDAVADDDAIDDGMEDDEEL